MQILSSLGVNSTIWLQLACFLISYVALTQLVLKPYLAAYNERQGRTVGNEEKAVRLLEETNEIQSTYADKVRAINSEMKAIYDASRTKALKASRDFACRSARRSCEHFSIRLARPSRPRSRPLVKLSRQTFRRLAQPSHRNWPVRICQYEVESSSFQRSVSGLIISFVLPVVAFRC